MPATISPRPETNLISINSAVRLGGPIRKDKTFFFIDYQAKMQRLGVPFTGLVPTTAMMTPDATGDYNFNLDPFGNPRGSSTFPILTNPYATGADDSHFQCIPGTATPEPVGAGGIQPMGADCSVIPAAMVNPLAAKVIQLYPTPNAATRR